MDQGLYILGGIALLVVVLLAYLVYAIASYRSAVRKARDVADHGDQPGAEARYLAEDADDMFAAPSGGPAPSRAPEARNAPRSPAPADTSGVAAIPFHIPEVHRSAPMHTESAPPRSTLRGDAELCTELEEPTARQVTAQPAPVTREPAEPPSIPADAAPTAPYVADTPASPEPPAPAAPAAPVATPIPVAPAAPVTTPAPEAEPAPAVPSLEEPSPEPAQAPAAPATPGYSLGDELERLMRVAEEQQALMPDVQHEPPAAPQPADDVEPTFEAPPLMPPPSVGQALSSPAVARASAPEAGAESAPVADDEALPAETPGVPEYSLVAPVELHFTAGPGRVGVKPGTRSHAEFQRLAAILLGDLHAARDR